MGGYFLANPSYEKSLRAKYYYEIGEYKEALSLAKEAFGEDIYNRMAATVMAQSLTAMKYVTYLEDAKKYKKELDAIALHETITQADKAKIRLICSIMTSSYKKLAPSVITDKKLVEDAAQYNKEFENLFEKVTQ
jgi:tetratricopeptide (TPR) repeat protein